MTAATVNLIDTGTTLHGTITVDLPDCYAPIAGNLVRCLLTHAVFSGERVGEKRVIAEDMRPLVRIFPHLLRGRAGIEYGRTGWVEKVDQVEIAVTRAIRHLHAHVYGDQPAVDTLRPTGYIQRIAKN